MITANTYRALINVPGTILSILHVLSHPILTTV